MSVVQPKVIKSEKMEYLSCYWTNKGRFGLFEISMKRLFKLKTFQSIKNLVKQIWVCTHSLSLSVSPGKCMGHITGQAASFPPCSRPTCTEFFFNCASPFTCLWKNRSRLCEFIIQNYRKYFMALARNSKREGLSLCFRCTQRGYWN